MNQKDLWLKEEAEALMEGWDFSHIEGRYEEEDDIPWDYRQVIGQYLTSDMKLLDIDTGGGEFLRSLNHPPHNTAATEGYAPNVELCRRELCPLGIDFRPCDGKGILPFRDGSFDIVINRHGDFHAAEIFRVLKDGGLFITQQVGAENDRELVELLLGDVPLPFPQQTLSIVSDQFSKAGFSILRGEEHFGKIRFFDVGALVWFAKIIEWEFPEFSVETHEQSLQKAWEILEKNGVLQGRTHRFLLVAKKPEQKVIDHYDGLLSDGNDPILDPPVLQAYMNKWDGAKFIETMRLSPSSRVLEIGVGTGRLALRTAPLCGRFVGIDLAPRTVEAAREHLKTFPHASVICGDFLAYSFGEKFDVIYSSLTFMHIRYKQAAIEKCMSLLVSGGRLVLSLDKNRETLLDAGYGALTVCPDDPSLLRGMIERHGGTVSEEYETEFATVLVAENRG